ncbi:hypothetical protein TELCIR_06428 [Teladorsagia circumcincta]|uniref:Endonuclease/exonuclease/phosphatase domain-containing protein n=1 Tax=Teladorsagia circumcincta TaxID=45464 RepID=A0A2G9UNC8_TELCI|nr:hypothetical protein TELCIR_06428 [Teladorsagia circumcincta]
MQVYASMCDSSEEQHEDFYDDLEELARSQKSSCVVVSGDFNAGIGSQRQGKRFIGPNSAEPRNAAGERHANFCEVLHLYHGNSQFMKTPMKRWTYDSPNGQNYHELDHVLCNRGAFTNIGVIPSFNIGSVHRLLRAMLHSDRSLIRLARIRSRQPRATVLDAEAMQTMMNDIDLEMMDDIDEDYNCLLNTISTVASRSRMMAPNHNFRRITEATRKKAEKTDGPPAKSC